MKRRVIEQQWRRSDIVVSMIPIILGYVSYLVGWIWVANDWPTLFSLPPTFLMVVVVLGAGSAYYARAGVPARAYAWPTQILYFLLAVVGLSVGSLIAPDSGIIPKDDLTAYTIATQSANQLLVLVGLIGSLLLARRSIQDGMFFFLLFLGARILTYPVYLEDAMVVSDRYIIGALCVIALVEGFILMGLFYRFLTGVQTSWSPILYLVGLLMVDPWLKLWPLAIETGAWTENVSSFGSAVGSTMLFLIGYVLVAYVSIRIYLGLYVHRNR